MGNSARIVCALLASAIVCACLVVGVNARFVSEDESRDEARVATFSIDASGSVLEQSVEADLVPGDSMLKELEIDNNSEVAVEYTITATNETRNLPLELTLKKTGSAEASKVSSSTVSLVGQMDAGSPAPDKYGLTIKWPTSAGEGSGLGSGEGAGGSGSGEGSGEGADSIDPRDPHHIGMVDRIVVTVKATQVD